MASMKEMREIVRQEMTLFKNEILELLSGSKQPEKVTKSQPETVTKSSILMRDDQSEQDSDDAIFYDCFQSENHDEFEVIQDDFISPPITVLMFA